MPKNLGEDGARLRQREADPERKRFGSAQRPDPPKKLSEGGARWWGCKTETNIDLGGG